jgi:predicted molibdopterin-dependent oxidoreductase YjgC
VDAVISLGHGILDPRYLGGTEALASLDTVIVLDSHVSALERVAHVLLPARVAAEKYATFTNHAGRVQRVAPALEPSFEAHPEGALLARLGAAMGLEGMTADWHAREVSRTLAATLPAFAGCDWEGVGAQGRALAEPEV